MDDSSEKRPDFMRPQRMPSINRPGAGYFENSDTDDDDPFSDFDSISRSNSVVDENTEEACNLPVVQMRQRESYKEGYLYKQGGKKADQGWKKRWMVFDGETLKYYPNNKTPVSLRIVPVSLMEHVEIVKDGRAGSRSSSSLISSSSRQYQFTIQCKNRTFLFGTDDPDNRAHWSHTIMEAILNQQKLGSSSDNSTDMEQTQLTGCAKFNGRKNRYYMALKGGKLYYYYNETDFNINFPVHVLNMETTNVQEVDGKLQLNSPPNQKFVLQFDSAEAMEQWKIALEDSIAQALGDDEVLHRIRAIPGNEICADCGAKDPEWASVNLCIVICKTCAGIHRGLGVDISKVRSLRMDKVFSERKYLIKLFEKIGNTNANKFWTNRESSCECQDGSNSMNSDSSYSAIKGYITQKYNYKTLCDPLCIADSVDELNAAFFKAVMSSDLLLTMKFLKSGADILCNLGTDSEMTAYDLACDGQDEEIAEYLYQNGGSVKRQVVDQNGHAVLPKVETIYLDGYLEKTGPKLKGFNKRKCILENGKMKYYKNNTLKGSIDMLDVKGICKACPCDKRLFCFDVICNIGGEIRTYRFSAADEDTRDVWISYMQKAMKC